MDRRRQSRLHIEDPDAPDPADGPRSSGARSEKPRRDAWGDGFARTSRGYLTEKDELKSLQAAFDEAPVAYFIVNSDFTIIDANKAALHLTRRQLR